MDNKKIATWLGTIVIIIFAITAGFFVWQYEKNQIINTQQTQNQAVQQANTGSPLIYPGSILMGVYRQNSNVSVTYETYAGNVQSYYNEKMQESGWVKTADLGKEDVTFCGGDWGGTFEKGSMKLKLHICGPAGKNDFLKDISFLFYNIEPEKVLGTDLSGGNISCVNDAEIEIVKACYTTDTLKISVKPKNSEINIFQVEIMSKKYTNGEDNVKPISSQSGIKEIETRYDPNLYGNTIDSTQITPNISSKGATYYCTGQAKESKTMDCR